MKVMTVLGTRPELIRLSRIIPALDEVCDHTFVWTGQNYDPKLSDVFFEELGIRAPDEQLGASSSSGFAPWVGSLFSLVADVLEHRKPDRLLILGDTNSGMAAYVAKRMGIPVYHMEAGNRCYDDRVPEEVNRRVIDACSDVLLPYTNRSRDNLLAEGYPARKIHVTGNPIWEVLEHYKDRREEHQGILDSVGVGSLPFFLATAHRAENVDDPERLHKICCALNDLAVKLHTPVIVSTHPRTRDRMQETASGSVWLGADEPDSLVRYLDPMGFHAFTRLEQSASCVFTDSGTVQEEAALFGVPCVVLRDSIERPELQDCGASIVAGVEPDDVVAAARGILKTLFEKPSIVSNSANWNQRRFNPEGYRAPDCAATVVNLLLSRLP